MIPMDKSTCDIGLAAYLHLRGYELLAVERLSVADLICVFTFQTVPQKASKNFFHGALVQARDYGMSCSFLHACALRARVVEHIPDEGVYPAAEPPPTSATIVTKSIHFGAYLLVTDHFYLGLCNTAAPTPIWRFGDYQGGTVERYMQGAKAPANALYYGTMFLKSAAANQRRSQNAQK